jgi:hypothetical protein
MGLGDAQGARDWCLLPYPPAYRTNLRIVPEAIIRVRSTNFCRADSSGNVTKSSESTSSLSAATARVCKVGGSHIGDISPIEFELRAQIAAFAA